jgi:hypothetical protein
MARVELRLSAVRGLDRMIVTHSLPPDTRARVQRSLRIVERFPSIGRQLGGQWEDFRFIIGPWRWLLIVYVHDERRDVVFVVSFQDARSSTAVTHLINPQ